MTTTAPPTGMNASRAASATLVAAGLILITALGATLRLYAIRDQVLLDDEWHGLYYVIGKNVAYLLTHFSVPGATCIPLNLYSFALLQTVGWNETILRLPSLAAGIASLIVLPLLAFRLFGWLRALLFGAFLAVSPFLVFYSRVARPYSFTMLLGAMALFAGCLWIRDGNRRYGIVYALAGTAAVYFHLYAAPAVAAPLLTGIALRGQRSRVGARCLTISALAMVAALGILIVPALVDASRSTMTNAIGAGHMNWRTVWGIGSLFSGTSSVILTIGFLGLVVWGAVCVFRTDRATGIVFLTALLLYVAALCAFAPAGMHSPIVASRYCIVLFPAGYVLAACGVDRASSLVLPSLRILPAITFPVAIFVTGPLVDLYAQQNNFTNHIAFQQNYEPLSWERSHGRDFILPESSRAELTISRADIAPFYSMLAADAGAHTIIEYPMMLGDQFNPYYYYQHFHGRRVMIGYVSAFPMRARVRAGGYIFGNTYVDEVLGSVSDPSKLRFRNMVNVETAESIGASGASYIVIHRKFEAAVPGHFGTAPTVDYLQRVCFESFGAPVFADQRVVAFAIRR